MHSRTTNKRRYVISVQFQSLFLGYFLYFEVERGTWERWFWVQSQKRVFPTGELLKRVISFGISKSIKRVSYLKSPQSTPRLQISTELRSHCL